MTDKKLTISRSYSRKVNCGNYETRDYFAAYSLEVDADTDKDSQQIISADLFESARQSVEESIFVNAPLTEKLVRNAREGKATDVRDYQKAVEEDPLAAGKINEAKKEFNREEYAKKHIKIEVIK